MLVKTKRQIDTDLLELFRMYKGRSAISFYRATADGKSRFPCGSTAFLSCLLQRGSSNNKFDLNKNIKIIGMMRKSSGLRDASSFLNKTSVD